MAKMNVDRARGGDDDFGTVGAEPTMPARYAGTCATCGQRFSVGDPIASVLVDKKTTYHHGACRYPATALLAQGRASAPAKCRATTSKGKPCNNTPQKGEQFCGPHLTQRVGRSPVDMRSSTQPDAVCDQDLLVFMRAISDDDTAATTRLIVATPELATARLATGGTRTTSEDFFLSRRHMQLYSGDTALHVAAASYDTVLARKLVAAGADVRAKNRRGAEPLHAAVIGAPGSSSWDPRRQAAVIRCLIELGADPDATAGGGVTPLLRAVRNRCSAAVQALLDAGADTRRTNDNGSTALDLARLTTGRGGTGSPEAKAEQAKIIQMLESAAKVQTRGES